MKPRGPLKRKTPLRSTKPMAPGTSKLKRSATKHGAVRATGKPRQKALKARGPKMTPIRKSAKGEDCTLRFPGICKGDRDTVVWCHSNHYEDGKGAGLKARDEEGCYGCHDCHKWLDGGYAGHMPRMLVDKYFDLARTESQTILKRKGLME